MRRRTLIVASAAAGALAALRCAVAAPPPPEQARIDALIRFVEGQKGMKFIRNGTEYECAEAARFLRGKLDSMGGDVTTAREFIERVASKSSMSGQPYQVRLTDGRLMPSAQFLGDELKRMEGRGAQPP
jgi:hypothetical protein